MSEWIDVKDRMPDGEGEFLCWEGSKEPFYSDIIGYDDTLITPSGSWRTAFVKTFRKKDGVLAFNCGGCSRVTHWMPLPEPPVQSQNHAEDKPKI